MAKKKVKVSEIVKGKKTVERLVHKEDVKSYEAKGWKVKPDGKVTRNMVHMTCEVETSTVVEKEKEVEAEEPKQ